MPSHAESGSRPLRIRRTIYGSFCMSNPLDDATAEVAGWIKHIYFMSLGDTSCMLHHPHGRLRGSSITVSG